MTTGENNSQSNPPQKTNKTIKPLSTFYISYQNVRGLNTKTHDILNSSYTCQFEVIALTETWLDDRTNNAEIICGKYNVLRYDRNFSASNTKRGGGVLIAVDNKYKFTQLKLDYIREQSPLIDVVGVSIVVNHIKLLIFVVYVPPALSCAYYSRFFESFETLNYLNEKSVVFLGDFNIPEYKQCLSTNNITPHTLVLQEFVNFYNFVQFNHISNSNNRLLDLIFSNNAVTVNKSDEILLNEDAHHPALVIGCSIAKSYNHNKVGNKNTQSYNFRKANFPLLYETILHSDWSLLNNFDDVNAACCKFYEMFYEILDSNVPKFVSYNNNNNNKYPPWFNGSIIRNIKLKFGLWKRYKKTGSEIVYNQFKEIRSSTKKEIDIAHKNYLRNIEYNIKTDVKSFWDYVNTKRGTSNVPDTMVYNDKNLENMDEIVNSFANFFGNAFAAPSNISDITDHEIYNNCATLHLTEFSEADVLNALKRLKPKFTKGPDNIPAFIIRDCAHALVKPLTVIFNLSLRSSKFPDIWKHARICAVYKKGDRGNVENYRQITIICNFAKVFEIALHDILYWHLQGQITMHQHGFMRNRSTVTNLFCLTQYISYQMDVNNQVDVLYTDFSKAFDRLDHGILLRKLRIAGLSLSLVKLFECYLTGRTQYVECRGFVSENILVTSGVPQGSILGPLFFVFFINDIVEDFNVRYLLYADDVKIFCSINSLEDCIKLQSNLDKISDWCIENSLPLNVTKCSVLTFSKKVFPVWFDYHIHNITLSRPDTVKDLGVIFDGKLSFNLHVNAIVKASYKNLGFVLRNSFRFTDVNVLMLLFNAFVKSKLEYAALIWQPGYNTYTECLENVQRRFLKFLSFKLDGQYPAIGTPQVQLLNRFSMLSLQNRRKSQSLIFLRKLLTNKIDCSEILKQLIFYIPRNETRFQHTFYLTTPRTNVLKFSPLYFMCQNCNEFPNIDIFNSNYNTLKTCMIN